MKSKSINHSDVLKYQKVPAEGNNGKMLILAFLVILGILIYNTYFSRTYLSCKKDYNIVRNEVELTGEMTIKLQYRGKSYKNATMEQTFDLSKYDDDTYKGILESSTCEKLSFKKCEVKENEKHLTITVSDYELSDFDSNKTIEESKTEFEKNGYSCTIE